MEIRVWSSYSCNNSSSFHMVARFDSEELAADVASELKTFLTTHARQKDAIEDWEATTKAQAALGKKYGFDYTEYLS